ncbi:UbiA family prenyltransferase [Peribacillus frigoritolerans]|nr:UbiA family prenyltransferase [Peribacillus frigoritolerans]
MPPLIGWAAVDPGLDKIAWVLFAIMFLWQPPHFLCTCNEACRRISSSWSTYASGRKGFKAAKRSIMLWIICLMFIPFFLTPLGTPLVILAALLSTGWLILGIKGYKKKRRC